MELVEVMPGVDVQADIAAACPMEFLLPESGEVARVPHDVVTGEGFKLTWRNA
jgi:acyl CoA:acetate/3-ketoacid CoA transferase